MINFSKVHLLNFEEMSTIIKSADWAKPGCYDGQEYYLAVGWDNGGVARYREVHQGGEVFYQQK